MTTFIIDAENNIAALTAAEAAAGLPEGATAFASEKELQRLAAGWPAERLVEIWNGIPGVKAVTRFTNRKAGVTRVWKAIQGLAAGRRNATRARSEAEDGQPQEGRPGARQGRQSREADQGGEGDEARPSPRR